MKWKFSGKKSDREHKWKNQKRKITRTVKNKENIYLLKKR